MKNKQLINQIHDVLSMLFGASNRKEPNMDVKDFLKCATEEDFTDLLIERNEKAYAKLSHNMKNRLPKLLDYMTNFSEGKLDLEPSIDVVKNIAGRKSDFPTTKAAYCVVKDMMRQLEKFGFSWKFAKGVFTLKDTREAEKTSVSGTTCHEDRVVFTLDSDGLPDGTLLLPEDEDAYQKCRCKCKHNKGEAVDDVNCDFDEDLLGDEAEEMAADAAFADDAIALFYKVSKFKKGFVNREDINLHAAENYMVENALDTVLDQLHNIHYFLTERRRIRNGN